MTEPTVALVACSKQKLSRPAPAGELYTSPLFCAAADYCRRTYGRWYILSALHGLVAPDQVIEPYDVTLTRMRRHERGMWRIKVIGSPLYREIDRAAWDDRLYVHAGQVYRDALPNMPMIVPLAGLGIGQQLAWYAERRPRPWPSS